MGKTNKNFVKIYLAGRVPIGEENGVDPLWRKKYIKVLSKIIPNALFLDPTNRRIKETDGKAVFGRDLFLMQIADVVLVNAETSLGLGTAQEIVFAKYFSKSVIVVCPENGYYTRKKTIINSRKVTRWTHPFLSSLVDLIVPNVVEAGFFLKNNFTFKKVKKRSFAFIKEAIDYYLEKYLPTDAKMNSLLKQMEKVLVTS